MSEGLGLKVVRLYRLEGGSKTKAFLDIALGDFIVKGLKIIQGQKGLFLSMHQDKAKMANGTMPFIL